MPDPSLYNEKELLLLIAQGDEQAFSRLFHAWQARLFHYVKTIVKSPQIAEEVVMDVMTKLWLGKDLLPRIDNLTAFLFRIAYRRSIDMLRSAARNPQLAELLWENIEAAGGQAADESLRSREYEAIVREAIGLLSPQRRKAYQLSREQNKTHEEVADALNLSSHTVNNHISEATKFIRQYLADNLDLILVIAWFSYQHGSVIQNK